MNNVQRNHSTMVCADIKRLQQELEQRYRRAKTNARCSADQPLVRRGAVMVVRGK